MAYKGDCYDVQADANPPLEAAPSSSANGSRSLERSMNGLGAIAIDLEPGETWDDELVVTFKRDELAALLAAAVAQGVEIRNTLDEMVVKAANGDFMSNLLGPQVEETHRLLGSAIRNVTEVLLPKIAAEAKAEYEASRKQN